MTGINKVQVTINGEEIIVVSTESEEYMRILAGYIDNKISAITNASSQAINRPHMRNLLVALIIADELFKAQDDIQNLMGMKEKEIQKNERLQNLIEDLRKSLEKSRAESEQTRAELVQTCETLEQTREELAAVIESREMSRSVTNIINTEELLKNTWTAR